MAKQGDAKTQIAKALQGRRVRGGQDDMLRVEAAAPGFAGFYLDSTERVVLLQKPTAGVSAALVRTLVHGLYANSPDNVARVLMATAKDAEVRAARFSLSELMALEQSILARGLVIPGFVGVGVLVPRNVVEVYLADERSVAGARAALRSMGMPDSALAFDVSGPLAATSIGTWYDDKRPTFGGLTIDVRDTRYDTPDSTYMEEQSLGYNVRAVNQPGQPTIMLTAAHGINGFAATNGYTGLSVFQRHRGTFPSVATVTTNPPWNTSCPIVVDFCAFADVAAATYVSGVSGQRGVGVSTTQGNDGAAGTQDINGSFAISDVVDPTMVPFNRHNVFKSGMNTGTTSGTLHNSFIDAIDTTLNWGKPNAGAKRSFLAQSQVRIDSIGVGLGDSGGPVFVAITTVGVCHPYCALGLQQSGGPNVNGLFIAPRYYRCSAGKDCWISVSPWAAIEAQLGLGTLDPRP